MRIAKRILNTVLLCILIVMLVGVIQQNNAAKLKTSATRLTTDAAEQPDAISAIIKMFNSDTLPFKFTDALPSTAEGCSLVDVDINLKNNGTESADWLEVEVEPAEGDLAVYSLTGVETSIVPGATGNVNLKFVTSAVPEVTRRIVIKYYVHGQMYSVAVKA
jgi:hypothetical protein